MVLLFQALPATAAGLDNSLWKELLSDHVDYASGRVDYAAFKEDESKLDAYLHVLQTTDRDALAPDERMAFYINAYNSATIKLILMHYPDIDSIRDIGGLFSGPFSKKFIELEGETYSLDNIEHDILRPEFRDARIHFAVNCASKSCPPLYDAPYTGADIDRQLDLVTRNFINNPERTWLEGDTLHVTRIMDWYREDFEREGGILGFVKQYAEGGLLKRLRALGDDVEIEFQDYDWSLNDVEGF